MEMLLREGGRVGIRELRELDRRWVVISGEGWGLVIGLGEVIGRLNSGNNFEYRIVWFG
jgi:pyruvate/2-oxoacid:ferredoxin oxidoreductase beta subunit